MSKGTRIFLDNYGNYFKVLHYWKIGNDCFANMVIDRDYSIYYVNMYKFSETEKRKYDL